MAYIEIDLMGDDDDSLTMRRDDIQATRDEKARQDEMRKRALEDIMRRAPQPQVVLIPLK